MAYLSVLVEGRAAPAQAAPRQGLYRPDLRTQCSGQGLSIRPATSVSFVPRTLSPDPSSVCSSDPGRLQQEHRLSQTRPRLQCKVTAVSRSHRTKSEGLLVLAYMPSSLFWQKAERWSCCGLEAVSEVTCCSETGGRRGDAMQRKLISSQSSPGLQLCKVVYCCEQVRKAEAEQGLAYRPSAFVLQKLADAETQSSSIC